MRRRALMCGVLVLTWIVGVGQLRADEPGETAKERLGRAIELCDDGAYEAAHEILIGIDEDEIEGEAGQVVKATCDARRLQAMHTAQA